MIDVNQFVKKIDQWALVAKIDKKTKNFVESKSPAK